MDALPDAQLYLELYVNQRDTGQVIAVEQRAGRLFMPASTLQAVGMRLPQSTSGEIALDGVPGLHGEYDSQAQRLLISVPPQWLPAQFIGSTQTYPRSEALTSFGALFNYDVYYNDTDNADTYVAAWNELRLFDTWGTLSTTGQYRRTFGGASASGYDSGFRRYDTTWRYSDDERLLTYEAGDVISGALP